LYKPFTNRGGGDKHAWEGRRSPRRGGGSESWSPRLDTEGQLSETSAKQRKTTRRGEYEKTFGLMRGKRISTSEGKKLTADSKGVMMTEL